MTEQIEGLKKVQDFNNNNNVTRAATKKRVKQIPATPVITINSTSASNAKMEKPNEGESVGDNAQIHLHYLLSLSIFN